MPKSRTPVFEECRLKSEDFKEIRQIYSVQGRTVRFVYDLDRMWAQYEVHFTVPDKNFLFNFDVPGQGKAPFLLVLDPYGDECMSSRVRRAVFGPGNSETIGIRYDTGEIVRVGFIDQQVHGEFVLPSEARAVGITFTSLPGDKPFQLPPAYRKRIPELRNKKRPFFKTHQDHILYTFIDRWASYNDLRESLVIDLHFDGARLQVAADEWRTITGWTLEAGDQPEASTPPPPPRGLGKQR